MHAASQRLGLSFPSSSLKLLLQSRASCVFTMGRVMLSVLHRQDLKQKASFTSKLLFISKCNRRLVVATVLGFLECTPLLRINEK